MAAHAKARTQTRKLDRIFDETLFQRAAFHIKIARLAIMLKAHRRKRLAPGGEYRCLHRTCADEFTIAPGLFHQHAEAVIGGHVARKIDIVLKNIVRQAVDDAPGQTQIARGMEQRAPDNPADQHGTGFQRAFDDLLADAAVFQRQLHEFTVAALKPEPGERAVFMQQKPEDDAGMQLAQGIAHARMRQNLVQGRLRDAHLGENRAQGLPVCDRHLLPAGRDRRSMDMGQPRQRQRQRGQRRGFIRIHQPGKSRHDAAEQHQ